MQSHSSTIYRQLRGGQFRAFKVGCFNCESMYRLVVDPLVYACERGRLRASDSVEPGKLNPSEDTQELATAHNAPIGSDSSLIAFKARSCGRCRKLSISFETEGY